MPEGRIFADISVSLDGFITGPNDSPELGLGEGGERLHEWIFGLKSWREPHGLEGGTRGPDDDLMGEVVERVGASVMGRTMFDHAEAAWGDNPPFHLPVFVVTHRTRNPLVKQGGTTFTFVEGIEDAVAQAKEAAGGKDVAIAGGASVIQQALSTGLLDELQIHLVPILLGGGTRLLEHLDGGPTELEKNRVIDSSGVTHIRFRVPK